jgi:hypothetical protein
VSERERRSQGHDGAVAEQADQGSERAGSPLRAAASQLAKLFQRLTGINPRDRAKVKEWQREHGVEPTGVVRRDSIAAAKRDAGPKGEVCFGGDAEAEKPIVGGDAFEGEGVDEAAPAIKSMGAHQLDVITEGASGQEKREPTPAGDTLGRAGTTVSDAREGLEAAASTGPINPALPHGLGGEEEGGPPWFKAAMAPAIVAMLVEGRYGEAAKTLALSFSPTEYLAGLEYAAEKLGLHVAAKLCGRLAGGIGGAVANVLVAEMLWAWEGFTQIKESHEAGDRDNRIRMYSSAFAEAFLYGEGAAPRVNPVTTEEREAVAAGLRDGRATAGNTGEAAILIGRALLDKYGGADNAKRAIIDALFIKAGMTGYKLHEGA